MTKGLYRINKWNNILEYSPFLCSFFTQKHIIMIEIKPEKAVENWQASVFDKTKLNLSLNLVLYFFIVIQDFGEKNILMK